MNKDAFLRFQKELKPSGELHHPLLDLCGNLSLLALYLFLAAQTNTALYLFSQLTLGVLILRSLFLMHECAHGLAFKNKTANEVVGNLYGLFCFLPFSAWKWLHLKHHTYAGIRGMDPLLMVTGSKGSNEKFKFIRKALAFLWRIGFPFIELIRSLGYMLSPLIIHKRTNDRPLVIKSLISAILIIATWVLGSKFFPDIINLKTVLPGIGIYLVLNELISLPQHLDMPSEEKEFGTFPLWQHAVVTRSVKYPNLIARHIFLNFNLHTEHHIFPRLPWRQLPDAQKILRQELGESYKEASWDWSLVKRQESLTDLLKLKDVQ